MEESFLKTISNQVSVRAFIWYYLLSAYINYFIQFFFLNSVVLLKIWGSS